VLVVLLAAIVAGAAGVGGSYFGARAVVQSSQYQIQAAKAQAAKDKRASVYAAYLNAANSFAFADKNASDFLAG